MSAEATGWTWKHSPYNGSELLVHLAIADVVNDANENEFWMSTGNLAKKAKVARSTVSATLRDMVLRHLLLLLEAGGPQRKPSRYRFNMPADRASTSAIQADSLARSPDRNPKEITQEPKAFASQISTNGLVPDPNCIRCHGDGHFFSGAGFDQVCGCCDPRPRVASESTAEVDA